MLEMHGNCAKTRSGETASGARMRPGFLWLLTGLLMSIACLAMNRAQAGETTAAALFESADTLELTLRLPWQTIVSDEFFYQGGDPSELEFTDEQGRPVSMALETERRGKSRQVVCRYPPIKLRFHKDAASGTVFAGQKSLKMVTHCDRGRSFEQYHRLEALAYRMYNLVTDRSFRIRPLSVTYIDTESGKPDGPRFAFLVEDDGALARRNGLKKLKTAALDPQRIEAVEASRLALFQYMIGNTAWSLEPDAADGNCCENLELLTADHDKGPVYAVPNDFDSSGLVNAHYATPARGSTAGSVRQRVFLGFCAHNATLDQARRLFLEKADAIRALVQNEPALNADTRNGALTFLDSYFDLLADPAQFEAQITSNCQTPGSD